MIELSAEAEALATKIEEQNGQTLEEVVHDVIITCAIAAGGGEVVDIHGQRQLGVPYSLTAGALECDEIEPFAHRRERLVPGVPPSRALQFKIVAVDFGPIVETAVSLALAGRE